jgi:hypothetical protein
VIRKQNNYKKLAVSEEEDSGLQFGLSTCLKIVNSRTLHNLYFFKNINLAGCLWLMPVILATQEAEIRRIVV